MVDAAGGSADFADAAERELAALFGGTPGNVGVVLPPTDKLYTAPAFPAAKIAEVDYRNYMRRHTAGKLETPRVRGIEQGGRTVVYFSREDLSGGLVGQPVDGIMGYAPDSATAIMRNIVLTAGAK